jgi:hypothetical protein
MPKLREPLKICFELQKEEKREEASRRIAKNAEKLREFCARIFAPQGANFTSKNLSYFNRQPLKRRKFLENFLEYFFFNWSCIRRIFFIK